MVFEVSKDTPTAFVLDAYKRKRAEAHPDRGGTPAAFHRVQQAWNEFCSSRTDEMRERTG
jgi:hypothetical protein